MKTKKSIYFSAEPETWDALDELAKKLERSRSWVVTDAVKKYINQHYGNTKESDHD